MEVKTNRECNASKVGEVICLCGSTKFKEQFILMNKELTLNGWIVLSVGFFAHADNKEIDRLTKARLDILHFKKIDLCQAIYVIDVDEYIGESTEREICYAMAGFKKVFYWSKMKT